MLVRIWWMPRCTRQSVGGVLPGPVSLVIAQVIWTSGILTHLPDSYATEANQLSWNHGSGGATGCISGGGAHMVGSFAAGTVRSTEGAVD